MWAALLPSTKVAVVQGEWTEGGDESVQGEPGSHSAENEDSGMFSIHSTNILHNSRVWKTEAAQTPPYDRVMGTGGREVSSAVHVGKIIRFGVRKPELVFLFCLLAG